MYVADLAVKKMVAAIRVRKGASNIAVNPSTNKVYVSNSESDTISVFDGLHYKLEANVPVGRHPYLIAVNPDTKEICIQILFLL